MIEVIEKKVFICPYCQTAYSSPEKAEACMESGKWLENFNEDALPWKWCILKNSYGNVMAYLPETINRKYTWAGDRACIDQKVSLFNSYSNSYCDITPSNSEYNGHWLLDEVLDISTGWEKYRFVPPMAYIGNMPESVREMSVEVLKKAMDVRQNELLQSKECDKVCEMLINLEFPEMSLQKNLDIAKTPSTIIITGEKLLGLEKWLEAFKKPEK